MIHSMTGYAAASRELTQGTLNLELRSVNHRYLDVVFRMDEIFRPAEPMMREAIARQINRGKLECRLMFSARAEDRKLRQINSALVEQLVQMNRAVQGLLPEAQPLSVADILRWPGVIESEELPADSLQEMCLSLLQAALAEFAATRGREGEKLKELILQRVAQMEGLVAQAAPHIPRLLAAYQEKLAARLREAQLAQDDERIRQELALFAQKIDVDEELSRLQTHLSEVKRVLSAGGAVGKRLDFLMQELNREANTLGSKSVASELSQLSMELKVLIEQMREQIQNIE